MKRALDIRRVTTPVWQRRVASQKRTLRRRSVRAARSVWSSLQSRATEFRNFIVEVFLLDPGGTTSCCAQRTTQRSATRPESASGAKQGVDVLGTWESLCFPVYKITGVGRNRNTTSRVAVGVPAEAASETTGTGRVPIRESETKGSGSDTGSLSHLIMAFESRETFSRGSL